MYNTSFYIHLFNRKSVIHFVGSKRDISDFKFHHITVGRRVSHADNAFTFVTREGVNAVQLKVMNIKCSCICLINK